MKSHTSEQLKKNDKVASQAISKEWVTKPVWHIHRKQVIAFFVSEGMEWKTIAWG